MSTQQTAPQQAQPGTTAASSIFDDILDATVRAQAEQAKADMLMGRTYGPGMGIAAEAAALKIAFGRDYGFGPAQSLRFIHLINGAPALEASGRSNLLAKAGYEWRPVKHDSTECRMRFWRRGEPMLDAHGAQLEVTFTMADAERAGFAQGSRGKGDKGNYDRVPMNMLFARCLANFHRWYAPEVDGSGMLEPTEITLDEVVRATEVEAKTNDAVAQLRERLAVAVTKENDNA